MSAPPRGARNSERAVDDALARSVLYRTMTLGLSNPAAPDAGQVLAPSARRTAVAAAQLLDSTRIAAEPIFPAAAAWASLPRFEAAALARTHARLFGHSRGLVCPYETEYGQEGAFHQPQELADIAGYYLAFGLRPAAGADERVDHVACECEFMDFLCRKEAYALAGGPAAGGPPDEEMLEVVREAARSFVRNHLGRFGRAFARSLSREDQAGFYGRLGEMLFRFLGLECERLGVPAGPATLDLRMPAEDDVPVACAGEAVACGAPSPLVQIRRRR